MKDIACIHVQSWLRRRDTAENLQDPFFAEICTHVASCDICQGAILVLLAESGLGQRHAFDTTCQECLSDLAAYIDMEREAGPRVAMQEYPHVWWHILTCPACFEEYQLIMVLIDAEQSGKLASMHTIQPITRDAGQLPLLPIRSSICLRTRLHIPRKVLSRTLAVQPMLGIMRGADGDDTVLLDDTSSGSTITLSVQKQDDASWNILVTMIPPISGQVVVTFGATVFRASFAATGQAVITNVPASLLTASEGPDMDIAIEPADAESDSGT